VPGRADEPASKEKDDEFMTPAQRESYVEIETTLFRGLVDEARYNILRMSWSTLRPELEEYSKT
jgi:hypothetical protein